MTRLISDADHRQALDCGDDVPEQSPSFAMRLNEVGISGKTVWVLLSAGRLPFKARVYVDLPPSLRGIHMSRIEAAISVLYDQSFADLSSYGEELARLVLDGQQGNRAKVSLQGLLPCPRKSLVSQKKSVDSVEISVKIILDRKMGQNSLLRTVGVSVYHITSCPCTQLYNSEIFRPGSGDAPMPTHSQRSRTTLSICTAGQGPSHEELFQCLQESLHLTSDLLKRPDEAELVMSSHVHPQFAEDAVRETARCVGKKFFASLPGASEVTIETLSFESIHIHDVHCRIHTTLGVIKKSIKKKKKGQVFA